MTGPGNYCCAGLIGPGVLLRLCEHHLSKLLLLRKAAKALAFIFRWEDQVSEDTGNLSKISHLVQEPILRSGESLTLPPTDFSASVFFTFMLPQKHKDKDRLPASTPSFRFNRSSVG